MTFLVITLPALSLPWAEKRTFLNRTVTLGLCFRKYYFELMFSFRGDNRFITPVDEKTLCSPLKEKANSNSSEIAV